MRACARRAQRRGIHARLGQIAQVQYTVAVALVGNFIINVSDMQARVASAAAVAARAALRRSRRRGVALYPSAQLPLLAVCRPTGGRPAADRARAARVLRACCARAARVLRARVPVAWLCICMLRCGCMHARVRVSE